MTGPVEPPENIESGGLGTPVAPPVTDELDTDEVPDDLVSEFSSLTTPYCWVITEDLVARYDGAEPSAVGKSGPDQAVAQGGQEAVPAGRVFRLADERGRAFAIGRLYDPSGDNDHAPLEDFGRAAWDAERIEYRAEGQWQPI